MKDQLIDGKIVQLSVSNGGVPKTAVPSARISQKRHAGWSRVYARVLVPGEIAAGDRVERLEPAEAAPHAVASRVEAGE